MTPPITPIRHARVARILHFALVAGLALVGVTFFALLRVQGRSLGGGPDVGYVLAAVAALLLVVTQTVLRRRMPERRFDQSPDDYWGSPDIRGASILLWAVIDGSGLLAWVGYVLTGGVAPAVAALLSIATLVLYRPSRLEGGV